MRDRCLTPEAPWGWLAAIAHNEGRRHAARAWTLAPGADAEVPAEADAADRRLDVARALRRLAPADRELVARRYAADQSHAAIGGALGLPEATVRVRLHRIRAVLATFLE